MSTKEGFLIKKGAKLKNWKKRWFVLIGDELKYFKGQHDKKPKGIIKLEPDFLISEVGLKPFCFQIMPADTGKRTYFISASEETEMKEWMAAIEKAKRTTISTSIKIIPPALVELKKEEKLKEASRQEKLKEFSKEDEKKKLFIYNH